MCDSQLKKEGKACKGDQSARYNLSHCYWSHSFFFPFLSYEGAESGFDLHLDLKNKKPKNTKNISWRKFPC